MGFWGGLGKESLLSLNALRVCVCRLAETGRLFVFFSHRLMALGDDYLSFMYVFIYILYVYFHLY